MPEVAFVMRRGQDYPTHELAETLRYELGLQAVPSAIHHGGFPEPRPSLVYVLVDPAGYVAAEGEQALPAEGILRRTIFLCPESAPSEAGDEYIALLRRAGGVFVVDQRVTLAMQRAGIHARLIRPGYSKSLDRFDAAAARPIDVMFMGARSRRRTRYLSRAARVLARHNCLLQISEDNGLEDSAFLAEGRWPLLARAKVLISLHRDERTRFDWRGALDAIHAGAVVVTEHSSGISPLVPGEHLVVTSADALPYVVESLLRDEQRLARLRNQAYERLQGWIPFALPVSVLRAALVELVGEPVPPGISLGSLSAERPEAAEGPAAPSPSPAPPSGPGQRSAAPLVAGIEVARESPAWAARRAPRVTVVTPWRGDCQEVTVTLDSLVRGRLRDFELVIVGSEPSEQTRTSVEDWISEHPRVAARLVVCGDADLGAARNIGLDFARGTFLLVLDPGQTLYPRGLEVLTGTLEAMPGIAFVYPMQEVTGADDISTDPHSTALIRTARLRDLGGFATDDHELWRRMADRGWHGQVVPQILVRTPEATAQP